MTTIISCDLPCGVRVSLDQHGARYSVAIRDARTDETLRELARSMTRQRAARLFARLVSPDAGGRMGA
jgi:hypothetical protein